MGEFVGRLDIQRGEQHCGARALWGWGWCWVVLLLYVGETLPNIEHSSLIPVIQQRFTRPVTVQILIAWATKEHCLTWLVLFPLQKLSYDRKPHNVHCTDRFCSAVCSWSTRYLHTLALVYEKKKKLVLARLSNKYVCLS